MIIEKSIIGIHTQISIRNRVNVPAKVDTGADSSAIWASKIRVTKDGILKFVLFGEGSPFYTGKVIKTSDFKIASVKSSNGQTQIRYRVPLAFKVNGRRVRAMFNLSDRSKNQFPVLIGRRTLHNKFIVDVAQGRKKIKKEKTAELNRELLADPYKFYKKYHKRSQK